MRMGKRPTRQQKILISSKRLNPKNWLVLQDMPDALVILHRHGAKPREIPKGGGEHKCQSLTKIQAAK